MNTKDRMQWNKTLLNIFFVGFIFVVRIIVTQYVFISWNVVLLSTSANRAHLGPLERARLERRQ